MQKNLGKNSIRNEYQSFNGSRNCGQTSNGKCYEDTSDEGDVSGINRASSSKGIILYSQNNNRRSGGGNPRCTCPEKFARTNCGIEKNGGGAKKSSRSCAKDPSFKESITAVHRICRILSSVNVEYIPPKTADNNDDGNSVSKSRECGTDTTEDNVAMKETYVVNDEHNCRKRRINTCHLNHCPDNVQQHHCHYYHHQADNKDRQFQKGVNLKDIKQNAMERNCKLKQSESREENSRRSSFIGIINKTDRSLRNAKRGRRNSSFQLSGNFVKQNAAQKMNFHSTGATGEVVSKLQDSNGVVVSSNSQERLSETSEQEERFSIISEEENDKEPEPVSKHNNCIIKDKSSGREETINSSVNDNDVCCLPLGPSEAPTNRKSNGKTNFVHDSKMNQTDDDAHEELVVPAIRRKKEVNYSNTKHISFLNSDLTTDQPRKEYNKEPERMVKEEQNPKQLSYSEIICKMLLPPLQRRSPLSEGEEIRKRRNRKSKSALINIIKDGMKQETGNLLDFYKGLKIFRTSSTLKMCCDLHVPEKRRQKKCCYWKEECLHHIDNNTITEEKF